jgi:hypothetical protein
MGMKGELTITFCSDPGEHTKPMNVVPLHLPENSVPYRRNYLLEFLILWGVINILMKVMK